jgi:hypothetical protein
MNFNFRKTAEELRRLLELRRSSASSPVNSKKKYNRKQKHRNKPPDEQG